MITLSSTSKSACSLDADSVSIEIFPAEAVAGKWTLLSHPQEETTDKAISWPGEYDFSGVTAIAIGQEAGRQVSYGVIVEGMRFAFIDTPVLAWTDADLAGLGDIDVLVIAADDAKKVQTLVEAVDPRIVVLFKVKDGDMAGVAKTLGVSAVQPVEELKLKAGSLPSETRQVVVLK